MTMLKILTVGVLAASLASCRPGQAGKPVVDCAGVVVRERVPQLIPVIQQALSGGVDDWRLLLAGIASSMGRDVLACALREVSAAPSARARALAPGGETAADRASKYISEQGWSFAATPGAP